MDLSGSYFKLYATISMLYNDSDTIRVREYECIYVDT